MNEYYEETGEETIHIIQAKGKVNERPIKIKGMKKHKKEVLERLRENPNKRWTINELRKLEGW